MSLTMLDMYIGQPGTSNTTLYTAPANTRVKILAATATNDTTTAAYFSVHRVASGGSVGDDNLLINQKVLSSRESYSCPELLGHVLEPGDFLNAIAEVADQITLHISGIAIT